MLYGVNDAPRNEFGDLIVTTANKVGTGFERDAKGQVVGPDWEKGRSGLVAYRVPGVDWAKGVMEPGTFADGSVRKGGYQYDVSAIPQKGYEERKPYVPSEFEVTAPRVGSGNALNRTVAESEAAEGEISDPHYTKRLKRKVTWPFMYVAGVR